MPGSHGDVKYFSRVIEKTDLCAVVEITTVNTEYILCYEQQEKNSQEIMFLWIVLQTNTYAKIVLKLGFKNRIKHQKMTSGALWAFYIYWKAVLRRLYSFTTLLLFCPFTKLCFIPKLCQSFFNEIFVQCIQTTYYTLQTCTCTLHATFIFILLIWYLVVLS